MRTHTYRDGLEVWTGVFTPEMNPLEQIESIYNERRSLTATRFKNAEGILRREVRRDIKSQIAFDETGKHLASISGKIPTDLDLPAGWGRPVDGVSCGVGFDCLRGPLGKMVFMVNVRNDSKEPREVAEALQYDTVALELRDAASQLVPQDAAFVRKRIAELARMNPGSSKSWMQTLQPGDAGYFQGYYRLEDWYPHLAPGTYTLTVHRRDAGKEFPLVSKPVTFEVTANR